MRVVSGPLGPHLSKPGAAHFALHLGRDLDRQIVLPHHAPAVIVNHRENRLPRHDTSVRRTVKESVAVTPRSSTHKSGIGIGIS